MLLKLLALITILAAATALVRHARRIGGYPAAADPYEAADADHSAAADVPQSAGRRTTTTAVRERPLPRRLRRVPIQFPPHVDPPMTDEQLAVVRARWPLLVSAYFRDPAER